jgi:imidazolonepropionase-like amidohydrolase
MGAPEGRMMKMRSALMAWCATAALSLPATAAEPPSRTTVLKGARLFDGRGDASVRNGVIVVSGGKIQAVGAGLAVPAGAEVIDLGDVTLLPGFIDAHTHVTGESTENWLEGAMAGMRRGIAESAVRATEYARRTVLSGFTTVRDVGSSDFIDVGLRNAINAGVVPGPRMLVAVNSLGARGGHCDNTGFPYMLFGSEPGMANGIAAGGPGFRDAVRFQVKYGADVIKVCATGGVLSLSDEVDTPQLTQEEMDALVDEAHRLRRKTAAHAHGAEGAKVAIRAGIDSIDHGSFLDDEAIRMMKERGTYLVPTAMAVKYVTSPTRSYPPEIAAKARAAGAAHGAAFRKAIQAGVKVALGTDSGVSPHGLNAQEFGLMVDHGMSPAAALRAGTSVAAALLGLERAVGALQPGMDADIVAVPGDPLADIRATEKVTFVMRGGKILRRE